MGKFDSPLGTKSFAGGGMREFEVPDESQPTMPRRHNQQHEMPDFDAIQQFQSRLDEEMGEDARIQELAEKERAFRDARAAKKNNKERLNDGAKRRIEMLVGMSRLSRSVNLDGNEFVLQTLRAKEMREVFTATAKFDGTVESPYEMRKQLVARSLSNIAGYDIEQFLGSDTIETRLSFIDELPEALLDRIFNEYQLLVKESVNKYSIKDEADAKEVLEDLKK